LGGNAGNGKEKKSERDAVIKIHVPCSIVYELDGNGVEGIKWHELHVAKLV